MTLFNSMNDVAINLIPFRHGQKKCGVEEGPEYIIRGGLETKLKKRNFNIVSKTEIKCDRTQGQSNIQICSINCQKIASTVHQQSKENKFVLNLGGDHSIGTGTLSGMLQTYPDLLVLWVDAHTDINSFNSSPSGSVHGMPVSFLLDDPRDKTGETVPTEYQWCRKNLLHPSRLAYIGIRQADASEMETVRKLNIPTFDMVTIDRIGIHECITTALRKLDPSFSKPIHVSFDIDSMDPSLIPCTGTPVKGGLTMREILYIAETVHSTGRLVSLDVVELNPKLTAEDSMVKTTVKNTLTVVKAFMGTKRPTFT